MKRLLTVGAVWLAVGGTGVWARSSQETATTPSLADVARQYRSDRAKAPNKPVKVYTNDNVETTPPEANPTDVGGAGGKSGTQTQSGTGGSSDARGEKYYRQKMGDLLAKLERHQRELEVLQQKLSQNQMQYYPDPNKTLQQEYTRGDVSKLNQDIEKKKQEIEADQKAIEDLQDQLRRDGGDPGWLRGPYPSPAAYSPPPAEPTPEAKPSKTGEENREDKKKTKEYWQAQFKAARDQVARAEEDQQLVEDELNLLKIQQAREVSPDVQKDVAEKITAKTAELEAKRAATATAKKALDDLQNAFNQSGAPPEWSKTA